MLCHTNSKPADVILGSKLHTNLVFMTWHEPLPGCVWKCCDVTPGIWKSGVKGLLHLFGK